ncbi:MAG: hypothetical protein WC890_04365 [Candidatus Margulisiibacteriota bacterium]
MSVQFNRVNSPLETYVGRYECNSQNRVWMRVRYLIRNRDQQGQVRDQLTKLLFSEAHMSTIDRLGIQKVDLGVFISTSFSDPAVAHVYDQKVIEDLREEANTIADWNNIQIAINSTVMMIPYYFFRDYVGHELTALAHEFGHVKEALHSFDSDRAYAQQLAGRLLDKNATHGVNLLNKGRQLYGILEDYRLVRRLIAWGLVDIAISNGNMMRTLSLPPELKALNERDLKLSAFNSALMLVLPYEGLSDGAGLIQSYHDFFKDCLPTESIQDCLSKARNVGNRFIHNDSIDLGSIISSVC